MHAYVSGRAGFVCADRELSSLIDWFEGLAIFPHRGTQRDDILPGLRVANHRGRIAVVALRIDESNRRVAILGVFARGRDFDAALRTPGA